MNDYRGLAPMDMSGNLHEKWKFWKQKFNTYLKATEICKKSEETQCAQLLQYIGDEAIHIYNTFKFEKDEVNKIDELIEKFTEYFKPKNNLVLERHKFFTRKQMQGETILQYVTDLKNKASTIHGDTLNFEKALKLCLSIEESKQQSVEISTSTANIHGVSTRKLERFRRYGENKHCSSSGKIATPRHSRQAPGQWYQRGSGKPVQVSYRKCDAGAINSNSNTKEWNVKMLVNKIKTMQFKIDTGSMVDVLPVGLLKLINVDRKLLIKSDISLTSYSNQRIPVLGVCYLNFHPPRKIPLPLIEKFKICLREMKDNNIIEKVDGPTEWVNSIVIVRKPNDSLRICLDPRDLNKQIPLFSSSSRLCTFGTPFGRYKFLRLPYELNSAPAVFHKRFKEIFNLEGVELYIDDIIIWGMNKEEHDQRLKQVLQTAEEAGIKFNKSKCIFGVQKLTYMGHQITVNGLSPDDSKIKAILEMPSPTNRKELQWFLGMITYVGKFIQNFSQITAPLRELLRKDIAWYWNEDKQNAIDYLKKILTSKPVLQYYDVNKPCILSADVSRDGLVAVLLQNKMPCAYASKAMTSAQKRYAQIEKELLAILFACEHFHQYIYGKHAVVQTDHKPLVEIFNKPLVSAPLRLQRMLMKIQRYDIELHYVPGKYLYLADTLSRATSTDNKITEPEDKFDEEVEAHVGLLRMHLNATDHKVMEIQKATSEDAVCNCLSFYIKNGWPNSIKRVQPIVQHYHNFRNELTEYRGLIYKGDQLFIPLNCRRDLLSRLPYGHFGVNKTQNRAQLCF
ncbi:hypothetical protein ILUMI_24940 [Ignelater luminosus]|uniref:Reverse transcriptase domain-containing protein n=1 Tax=Ignelater luminosus TaxID=2038154 RepID=A0A8K0FWE6_IGNLU|nr:hypothetical protein ILUMI_24940 [Ignelater luminosus]